jgi:hypothetical protein
MLIRFHHSVRSLSAYRLCLQCVLVLVLVLFTPFLVDGLEHDQYSVESTQTHFATSNDLVSVSLGGIDRANLEPSPQQSDRPHRLPTRRFLITTTATSYL